MGLSTTFFADADNDSCSPHGPSTRSSYLIFAMLVTSKLRICTNAEKSYALARSTGADEGRVQIGFPHSTPLPLPPDPEAEAGPVASEPEAALATPVEGAAPAPQEQISQEPPAAPKEPEVAPGKSAEQWQKESNEARVPLPARFSRQALQVLDNPDPVPLLFGLHVIPSSEQYPSSTSGTASCRSVSPARAGAFGLAVTPHPRYPDNANGQPFAVVAAPY
ncbi:hypothetical protein FPV67DRAFT_1676765 [Lyophyllum atratum]|nr:hypothetical protein FPV67DRAFT_1676765 [Lyophyllum atratum]